MPGTVEHDSKLTQDGDFGSDGVGGWAVKRKFRCMTQIDGLEAVRCPLDNATLWRRAGTKPAGLEAKRVASSLPHSFLSAFGSS